MSQHALVPDHRPLHANARAFSLCLSDAAATCYSITRYASKAPQPPSFRITRWLGITASLPRTLADVRYTSVGMVADGYVAISVTGDQHTSTRT